MTRKRLLAPEKLMWRTGQVGRTVYAMVGLMADDHDLLIGMFDTKALADAAVHAHNQALMRKAGGPR